MGILDYAKALKEQKEKLEEVLKYGFQIRLCKGELTVDYPSLTLNNSGAFAFNILSHIINIDPYISKLKEVDNELTNKINSRIEELNKEINEINK